jgi:aspartate aminotransferase
MTPSVKVVVLNSPCNPSGAVFERGVIRMIAEMAADRKALVLSDEVYECQAYDCETYSPASEYDHVITVNAFSKSHAMTGWRLGYVTGPREVLEGMIKIYQHSTSCVTAFAQAGGVEALCSEVSRQASRHMTAGYRQRRDLMVGLIAEADYLEMPAVPQGAFYCFPSYRLDGGSVDVARALLEEAHVATVPGAAFGACGEGHLRLSYATTPEAIREGFERMGDFFHRRSR